MNVSKAVPKLAPPLAGVHRLTFYNQQDIVTNKLNIIHDFEFCVDDEQVPNL